MSINPLYRVIIHRINNLFELIGIPQLIIDFTDQIEIKSFEYYIHKLPLSKISPDTIDDPQLIFYHMFNIVWRNIYKISIVPARRSFKIKSIYVNHQEHEYFYREYQYITDYKIFILLGKKYSYNFLNVAKTLTTMHSIIIEYYILINYISREYLIDDIRSVLHYYITESFINM